MPEDPVWRKCSGSFLITEGRKMSIQPDEASMLHEMDQDDLASECTVLYINNSLSRLILTVSTIFSRILCALFPQTFSQKCGCTL